MVTLSLKMGELLHCHREESGGRHSPNTASHCPLVCPGPFVMNKKMKELNCVPKREILSDKKERVQENFLKSSKTLRNSTKQGSVLSPGK